MNNKKSELSATGTLGAIALVMLLVAVGYYAFIKNPAQAAQFTTSSILIEQNYKTCQLKGERTTDYKKNNDKDNDNFPDDCDNCILASGDSKNDMDTDGDYVPDACDSNPNDAAEFSCKKGVDWNKRLLPLGRCVQK